jgi:replication-associated recombination protein RarA
VDQSGEPVGEHLLTRLIEDDSVRGCIVFAEPGSGKTTLMGQLVEAFSQRAPEGWQPTVVEFRAFLQRAWYGGLGLAETAEKVLTEAEAAPKRGVMFMDVPVPRFRRALTPLARRDDTLFVGLASDPRIQDKAMRVRSELRQRGHADSDVQAILARYQMSSDLDAQETALASHTMASPEIIEHSMGETLREAEMLIEHKFATLDDIALPPSAADLPAELQRAFRLKIAHARYLLFVAMGLSDDRAQIVLGDYNPTRVVRWNQAVIDRFAYEP